MFVPSSEVWKLALAFALGAAILMGAWGAAPRRSVPRADLKRLVACALLLYGVGGLASLASQLRVKSDRHQVFLPNRYWMIVERCQDLDLLATAADPRRADEYGVQRTARYPRDLQIALEGAQLTAERVALGGDVEQPQVLAVEHDHPRARPEHRGSDADQLPQWVGKAIPLDAKCHHGRLTTW